MNDAGAAALFTKIFGEPPTFSKQTPEALTTRMAAVLDTLEKARDREVLLMRYNEEKPMPFRAMGSSFGVSGARVRQIEVRALRRMRHPSRSRDLYDWWGSK